MILWNLDYDTWLKLWRTYKVRPYEMTGDHEFTETVIKSCKTNEELFHKFQWELVERRKNARKHKSKNKPLDHRDNRRNWNDLGMS